MGCGNLRDGIPARYVLCIMLFLGFMATFLLRVNINISVVAMVNQTDTTDENSAKPACLTDDSLRTNVTIKEQNHIVGEFDWNQMTQSIILGSFFWGYLLFQAPGGRVAELLGFKRVFGIAVLINGIMSLLIPPSARLHWSLLLVLRALQGLAQGVQFPALSSAVARWVPLQERSKFMSFAVTGASLGMVVSLPLCGRILSQLGWPAVFYTSGALALVWSLAWFVLVYETPAQHPRLGAQERSYLARNLTKTDPEPQDVPWKAVFTSKQFWLGCVAAWGNDWGFHTFVTLAPKYLKEALGFDFEQSSWLSSLPFLCQYVFANIYGALADELLKRKVSLVRVRKLSVIVSHFLPATCLVCLSFSGCNVTLSVAVLTLAVSFVGAFSSGFFQNPLDIAPNFAGSLTGIMNGISSLTGVISTPLAGAVLHTMGMEEGWRAIFLIAASMYAVCAIPYLFFATSTIQPWNESGRRKQVPLNSWETQQDPVESDSLTGTKRLSR